MSEERKAGQLIWSQLGMFYEALVLFNNVMEPAFKKGIDTCVESFVDDNDWAGEYELWSNDSCWLAPKTWVANPGEEEHEYIAWFDVDVIDDNDDSWAPCFCGVASQGGQAGFSFSIEPGYFGGRTAWNASAKKISLEHISALTRLGFQNKDKGKFFLPVTLDNQKLAQSWVNGDDDKDEFNKDDDCFIPLREALEKLKQAVPIFDQIIQNHSVASAAK